MRQVESMNKKDKAEHFKFQFAFSQRRVSIVSTFRALFPILVLSLTTGHGRAQTYLLKL